MLIDGTGKTAATRPEPPQADITPRAKDTLRQHPTPAAQPFQARQDPAPRIDELEARRDKLNADIAVIGAGTPVADALQDQLDDVNADLAQRDADRALADVERLLDGKGRVNTFFQTDEQREMHEGEVLEAVEILSDLSPEALNVAFSRLEEGGQLEVLLRELNDRSEVGQGISDRDQTEFYRRMVTRLDQDNLETLAQTVMAEDPSMDASETRAFAAVVAGNVSPERQIALVDALRDGITASLGDETRAGFFALDRESVAIAELLGAMGDTPDTLAAALETLSDTELSAVLFAAQAVEAGPAGGEGAPAFDRIVDAIGQLDGSNPAHFAQIDRVWEAGLDLVSGGGPGSDRPPFSDGDGIARSEMAVQDGLTDIFVTHGDDLLSANTTVTGVLLTGFRDEMTAFAEHVIFANPPGARQEDAVAAVIDLMDYTFGVGDGQHSDTRGLLPQIDLDANPTAPASVAGELFGIVSEGYGNALDAAQNDADADALARNFVIDLAFSVIPGPDGAGDFVEAFIDTVQSTGQREIKNEFDERDVVIDRQGFDEALFQLYRERAETTAANIAFSAGFSGPDISEDGGNE